MNRTTHLFTRLVALATVGVSLLLITAGQAAAQLLPPGPDGTSAVHDGVTQAPAGPIVDASVSVLQWTLFALAVLGALVVGAALMHVAQRRRGALPVTGGETSARYAA